MFIGIHAHSCLCSQSTKPNSKLVKISATQFVDAVTYQKDHPDFLLHDGDEGHMKALASIVGDPSVDALNAQETTDSVVANNDRPSVASTSGTNCKRVTVVLHQQPQANASPV